MDDDSRLAQKQLQPQHNTVLEKVSVEHKAINLMWLQMFIPSSTIITSHSLLTLNILVNKTGSVRIT